MRSHPISMEYSQSRGDRKVLASLLEQTIHQWDRRVKHALSQLGKEIWQDDHLMKLIAVHGFRLRHKQLPSAWVWWIEHDIPPYDRFRCAAYMFELYLNEDQQPTLMIRTGEGNHTLTGEDLNSFESHLAQAGVETPLFIYRDFGPAND